MRCRGNSSSVGDFDCAFGFPCNVSTGECECKGSAYIHDTTFIKIPNCGLPVVALDVSYVLISMFSLFVGIFSLVSARNRKRATKQFLVLGFVWCALLPFLQLSHYLEGHQFGVSTVIVFYVIIQLANIQVIMFTFQILSLLALLSKPSVVIRLKWFMVRWLALWSLLKIAPAIVLLVGVLELSPSLFNATVFAWALLLMAEVAINTTGQYCAMKSLMNELYGLGSSNREYLQREKVEAVIEFANRLRKVLPVAVIYGVIVWLLGIALIVLYSLFNSAVPYMWVLYIGMMLSWPILALNSVLLSRDATVKRIELLKDAENSDDKTFSLFQDYGETLRRYQGKTLIDAPLVPPGFHMATIPELSNIKSSTNVLNTGDMNISNSNLQTLREVQVPAV